MPRLPFVSRLAGRDQQGKAGPPQEPLTLQVDEVELSFIRVDHQTRLQFGETEVVIETPFTLRVGGEAMQLDPEERAQLGPLLGIYPDALAAATVSVDGTLELHFDGGVTISVPADPHYEAWQVNGPGNRLIVCSPGGALDTWT